MDPELRHQPSSFPLRLSASVLTAVRQYAKRDGVSINHFIELALVKELARIEMEQAGRAVAQPATPGVPAAGAPVRTPSAVEAAMRVPDKGKASFLRPKTN